MMMRLAWGVVVVALAGACWAAGPAPGGAAVVVTDKAVQRWGDPATMLVAAELTRIESRKTIAGRPPLYQTEVRLLVREKLRGALRDAVLVALHVVRQDDEPTFPVGKRVLATLTRSPAGKYRVETLAEASDDEVAQARVIGALPPGWEVKGGQVVSPWADLGGKAWPAGLPGVGPVVCAKTGRPALGLGADVRLRAEPVTPARTVAGQNPDGDGLFRISVSNSGAKPVTVPALFADARGNVLWAESVAVQSAGKGYSVPGAVGLPAGARPVLLEPAQILFGTVNVLGLRGLPWPRDGSAVELRFCLGDASVVRPFTYTPEYHDPIRERLKGK